MGARKNSMTSQLPADSGKVRGHGFEFGGPLGALALSTLLAPLCYIFAFLCNDVSGCPAPFFFYPKSLNMAKIKSDIGWRGVETIFNWPAFFGSLGWYILSLVLWRFLPAEEIEGVELKSGGKHKYRFNAFNSAMFTAVILAAGTVVQGADFPVWTFIWDNYLPIMTSNILISYLLATFVYVRSYSVKDGNTDKRELAAGGATGNMLYDWFIGRELNPRVTLPVFGEIDIKSFMEIRPGLLGWILLDCAFIARQYRNYGYVTDSIIIATAAQAAYVFDAMYNEPAILTTIDIIMDGFGFMLSFGDLAWVPFIYSIQARYLAIHPVHLGPSGIAAIALVFFSGYYIFRATNNEKNRFRTNPNDPRVSHLEYIETASGSKLLVSGWWGRARHINYLGDWLMSWAYCMPTGIAGYIVMNNPGALLFPDRHAMVGQPFAPVVVPGQAKGWGMLATYFFMIYFAVLLVHRERRDEEKCRNKYGKDWERYCEKVPWRIMPYVY